MSKRLEQKLHKERSIYSKIHMGREKKNNFSKKVLKTLFFKEMQTENNEMPHLTFIYGQNQRD